MSETISEIPIQEQVGEPVIKAIGRQALVETVPPYDEDSYGLLIEL